MKVYRYLILAMLFLPMVALAAPSSFSTSDSQTITYTSLSTITEGTTTATITIIAFNTTTYRTIEATTTLVKYVTTTTVFVEVRYGVTKAPHVIYVTTTTTLPKTLTQTEWHIIETTTVGQTLTTYGPPVVQGGIEEGIVMFLAIVAIALILHLRRRTRGGSG
jgi:hypothetical protein